jgi:hypothetical protein
MNDPDTLLRRRAAAAALTANGYPTAAATLATLASRGGGPAFRRYGRYPLYRWGDCVEWAQSRLGPVVCSTSEHQRAMSVQTAAAPPVPSPAPAVRRRRIGAPAVPG